MGRILGSDIGGTFTDFALLDEASGTLTTHKLLTTPRDPSDAIGQGIARLSAQHHGEVTAHVHGTTLVINAVIERKGARTGLITTRGFRDVLAIGREKRYDGYDLRISFPTPLVPRQRRMEIDERMHASGSVLHPLEPDSVEQAIAALASAGVESIAVSLLHSYRNPTHEEKVRDLLEEALPGIPVSISSQVLPEINEFERTSTTVVNAYTRPITERYVDRLTDRQHEAGLDGELFFMRSSGGVTGADVAREFPVQVIESGPAAGALGAAHFARMAGLDRVLAFDMGGTTAKLCLVKDGRVERTTEFEVAREHRFKKGSGLPVRIPVVDLMEIGAGGGSIARASEVGTIRVGPRSAGAEPGPACYGRGGESPTVTDADLLLGYLDAGHFLGGDMALDREASRRAIDSQLASRLGLDVTPAAAGVHAIVNENMASAAKVYVTEHGEDPAGYTLVAFGGAGPVHAYDLAQRLGVRRVLVPPHAGVASAVGMIVAPISYDSVRTFRARLANTDFPEMERLFVEMAEQCIERMPKVAAIGDVVQERFAEMRYVGQGYAIQVRLPATQPEEDAVAAMRAHFDRVYHQLYGRSYDDLELEILTLRLTATAPGHAERAVRGPGTATTTPVSGERLAWCPSSEQMIPYQVFQRSQLASGFAATGPLIVEEAESTTVVGPGAGLSVDTNGSLIIELPVDSVRV